MKNLSHDPLPAFKEYKDAVARKKGSDKSELESIEVDIEKCYNEYEQYFDNNKVEKLSQAVVGRQHKNVLLDMYGSDKVIIKSFRTRFFNRNPQSYNNLCPYCTINEANTTEHILPKELYPEFAVDLLNLIPSCSYCNTKKGQEVFDKSGKRITINYYKDELPNVQFLYVDINNNNGTLKPHYMVRNPNGIINSSLFDLIERHYLKYDLIGNKSRLDIKAIQELSELVNLYKVEGITSDEEYNIFAQKQIKKCDLDVKTLGVNHWRVVLIRSAAISTTFKTFIMSS